MASHVNRAPTHQSQLSVCVCVCKGVICVVSRVCVCLGVCFCVSPCCAFTSGSGQCVLIGLVTDWCIIHHLMESDRWLPSWVRACVSTCSFEQVMKRSRCGCVFSGRCSYDCVSLCTFVYFMCVQDTGKMRHRWSTCVCPAVENRISQSKQSKRSPEEEENVLLICMSLSAVTKHTITELMYKYVSTSMFCCFILYTTMWDFICKTFSSTSPATTFKQL